MDGERFDSEQVPRKVSRVMIRFGTLDTAIQWILGVQQQFCMKTNPIQTQ